MAETIAETLTESFCERCGSRYTFESAAPKVRLRGLRVATRGLKTFVLDDKQSFSEAMAAARSDTDRETTSSQLDAFHKTFNFCMQCRQYTCPNCWNEAEGRCLTCAPLASIASPAAPWEVPGLNNGNGNGHVHDEPVGPFAAAVAATNGHATDESDGFDALARLEALTAPLPAPAAEPVVDAAPEPQVEAIEPQIVAIEPEPEPIVAIEPEAEPIIAIQPEPEPIAAIEPEIVAIEAEPEAEPIAAIEAEPVVLPDVIAERVTNAHEQTSRLFAGLRPSQSLDATAFTAVPEPEPIVAAVEPEPEPVLATEPEPVVAAESEPVAAVVEPEQEPIAAALPEPEPVAAAPEPVFEPEPVAAATPTPVDVIEQPTWPVADPVVVPPSPIVPPVQPPAPAVVQPPVAATVAPVWPETPEWPAHQPSPSMPFLGRAVVPTGGIDALWAESDRAVTAQPTAGRPVAGVQPCVSCGLSLSGSARFCRRCGSAQR